MKKNSVPAFLFAVALLLQTPGCTTSRQEADPESHLAQILAELKLIGADRETAQLPDRKDQASDSVSRNILRANLGESLVSRINRVGPNCFSIADPVKGAVYGCGEAVDLRRRMESDYANGSMWMIPFTGMDSSRSLLLILSSISPKQVTIFKIDRHGDVSISFDSFNPRNPKPDSHFGALDFICGMTVVSANSFLLHEGYLQSISQVSPYPRNAAMTLSPDGTVALSFQ